MPVFVRSNKDGAFLVYDRIHEGLRYFVSEFWDDLGEFTFWDADGFRIEFDETFIRGGNEVERREPNEAGEVRAEILRYLDGKGLSSPQAESEELPHLYHRVEALG
jgi:hypothetical protein